MTDRKIPWDTWESIIKELENAKIILERPPKTENRVTRRTDFYLLTLREEVKEDVRRKLSLGLPIIGKDERLEKLYQLILYHDAEHHIGFKIPEYETEELRRKLSLIGLKSVDDLVIDSERGVDNNRVVATYYKSVSPCMEIRKRTIQSSLPWTSRIPDSLSSVRAVEYYFIFFGVSKKEILDSNNSRYLLDDIVFRQRGS